MNRLIGGATTIALGFTVSVAHATDIVSVHGSGDISASANSSRFDAGAGGAIEFDLNPGKWALRFGGDLLVNGWIGKGRSGNLLGLRPEIAVIFGSTTDTWQRGIALRPQFGLFAWNDAPFRLMQSVDLGPELSLTVPGGDGFRIGMGLYYSPHRNPDASWSWAGASLGMVVGYAWPTQGHVKVDPNCIELPTRPCP